jgi:subfamily B ATP-binding cassette protein MsbA
MAIAETNFSGGQNSVFIHCAVSEILDYDSREATSALDTEWEICSGRLENMMQNRTSIVIAHRLSTIQKQMIV